MTFHVAPNPRHTRVVNTDDAWWLKDAWNGRTFDWIADAATGGRFAFMLEGLTLLVRLNLPEALPTATWLAKLTEACFPSLPPIHDSLKHLPYEARIAFAAESWSVGNGESENATALRLASRHIMSLLPVTDELLDPHVLFSQNPSGGAAGGWSLKYTDLARIESVRPGAGKYTSDFLMGLAGNPSLPASRKPANPDTNMTIYRWMVSMALVGSGSNYNAKALLFALLKNPGATQDDFDFFLKALDQAEAEMIRRKEAKRARFDVTSFYKLEAVPNAESILAFRKAVAEHPNFVSWPSVDEAYPATHRLLPVWSAGLAATVDISGTLFEEAMVDSLFLGRSLKPRDTQEFLLGLLLDNTKRELVTQKVLGNIHNILHEEGSSSSSNAWARMLGLFSMTLGAVFQQVDEDLESKDIPFDWFKEML